MKKTLVIGAMVLPWVINAQMLNQIEKDVDMTFGRNTASGCDTHMRGSCDAVIEDENNNDNIGVAVRTSDTAFTVELFRNKLTAGQEINIAGKPFRDIAPGETLYFKMESDLVLDDYSLRNIGIDHTKYNLIAAGQYPLSVTSDKVVIKLTVAARK